MFHFIDVPPYTSQLLLEFSCGWNRPGPGGLNLPSLITHDLDLNIGCRGHNVSEEKRLINSFDMNRAMK
jgi:hypothetical protein